MTPPLTAITHCRVPCPDGLRPATVHIDDGRIAGVVARDGGRIPGALDAAGAIVLPGLVDLHCDAIEHQATPRPGGDLDLDLAFTEMDRQFATVGILTGCHAIAFLETSDRGLEQARALCNIVRSRRSRTRIHHHLHVRCEITQPGIADAVEPIIKQRDVLLVSLMDHTPGTGQFRTTSQYERFLRDRGVEDTAIERALTAAVALNSETARSQAAHLLNAARSAGALGACHDDNGPMSDLHGDGLALSEFPLSLGAARSAKERGLAVSVGAPNVLRGQSSGGHLSARDAIEAGLVDALCSDYHPPSLLAAVFALAKDKVCSLQQAISLATSGPAQVANLANTATITEGQPADLITVDDRRHPVRLVTAIVGGHIVANLTTDTLTPDDLSSAVRDPTELYG